MRMNKKKIVYAVIVLLTVCSIAYADSIHKNITIFYDNIKIYIDGKERQAKDVNGDYIEPYIYNDTT